METHLTATHFVLTTCFQVHLGARRKGHSLIYLCYSARQTLGRWSASYNSFDRVTPHKVSHLMRNILTEGSYFNVIHSDCPVEIRKIDLNKTKHTLGGGGGYNCKVQKIS